MTRLTRIQLTIILGQYAIAWHLKDKSGKTLTETVRNWKDGWPGLVPMPHPSPRNNLWLRRNPWFEEQVLTRIKKRVGEILK